MKPTRVTSLSSTYAARVVVRIAKRSRSTETGCIEWTGSLDRSGYGKINIKDGDTRKTTGVHRAAWLAMRGDIPEDLMIDHLCRNRRCANVDHMELVTNAENTRRADHSNKPGRSGRRAGGRRGCKQHGHSDGFERMQKNGYPVWHCRPCVRRRSQEWKAQRAAKVAA